MVTVATNIKRPLPSSSSTPAAKRARSSIPSSASSTHQDDDDDMDDVAPLNETMLERKARKDARTIRNRESAQRSRNQRKAHLAWLEVRVVELEEENKRLRSQSTTPLTSPTLVPSPLTIPLDIISPSYLPDCVNLATVAPPPPGIIPTPSTSEVDQLRAENAALRARLDLFDGIVKQVQAVSSVVSTDIPPTSPLDWNSIFTEPIPPIRQSSPTLYSTSTTLDNTQQSPIPLACHPAAGENGLGLDFGFVDSSESRMDRETVGWSGEGIGGSGPTQGVDTYSAEGWSEVPQADEAWDEGMRKLLEDLEGSEAVGSEAAEAGVRWGVHV